MDIKQHYIEEFKKSVAKIMNEALLEYRNTSDVYSSSSRSASLRKMDVRKKKQTHRQQSLKNEERNAKASTEPSGVELNPANDSVIAYVIEQREIPVVEIENETKTNEETNKYKCMVSRKIARRRKEPLNRKRKLISEAENNKRRKIEDEPSFLEKYKEIKLEETTKLEKDKEINKERMELEELKRKIAEMEKQRNEERMEAEKAKKNLEELRIASEKQLADIQMREMSKIKQEAEEAARKIKKEMEVLLQLKDELKREITNNKKEIIEKRERNQDRHQTIKIVRPEPTNLKICKASKPDIDANSFFLAAKREHIERINQTMLARDDVLKKSQPRLSPGMVEAEQPHKLYKQSIDAQSFSGSPRTYVPKMVIPFYLTEEEFNSKEKRFEPAEFAKDPNLSQFVRMQNHNKIAKYFGKNQEIDVERMFGNIENVSNYSPNKFVKK